MNNWKLAFFVCVALLLFTNFYWFFFGRVVYDPQLPNKMAINLLGALVEKGNRNFSKQEILETLHEEDGNVFVLEGGNKLVVTGIEFEFQNETVSKVSAAGP